MNWLLQILDPANIATFAAQFQAEMLQPAFWIAVGKIIWINVLLSGDNALVIALACRGLAPRQRHLGTCRRRGASLQCWRPPEFSARSRCGRPRATAAGDGRPAEAVERHQGGVGAGAEIDGVADRDLAGKAADQVPGRGGDGAE